MSLELGYALMNLAADREKPGYTPEIPQISRILTSAPQNSRIWDILRQLTTNNPTFFDT